MGISHHVGDKLTYHIYCEDTHRVVSHSVIWTADPRQGAILNQRLDSPEEYLIPEESFTPDNIQDSGEFDGKINDKTSSFKIDKPSGIDTGENHETISDQDIRKNDKDSGEFPQENQNMVPNQDSGEYHKTISTQDSGETNNNSGEFTQENLEKHRTALPGIMH